MPQRRDWSWALKILLVDDDLDLLDVTTYALQRSGHHVMAATDGADALKRWIAEEPDIIILDLGIPKVSGLDVCQTIRRGGDTPIILLSEFTGEDDMVRGFAAGADDYITKPFSMRVLLARIEAVWSRSRGNMQPSRDLQIGSLVIDIDSHEARKPDGSMVRLTPIEFEILRLLAVNAGRVMSRNRLVERAWSLGGGDVMLLKTHISHIRKKLGDECNIESIPGVGYRLVKEQLQADALPLSFSRAATSTV